jgi:hypothetical protein
VIEHPAQGDTVDFTGVSAEANNAAGELIHDHQDPMTLQRDRLAAKQIHAPQTVFHVAKESQPGRSVSAINDIEFW